MSTLFDIILNPQLNNNNHRIKRFKNQHQNQKFQKKKEDLISWSPEIDVLETKDALLIETELPGVNKEDIQIEIKDSKLYIQGEKKKSTNVNFKESTTESSSTTTSSSSTPVLKGSSDSIDQEFEDSEVKETSDVKVVVDKQQLNSNQNELYAKNHISERTFGHFKRLLDLNKVLHTLDLSSIKTSYNNGLLSITINKKPDYSNTIKITLN